MKISERYIKEMDEVQFSESFERDTVRLLSDAAGKSAESMKEKNTMDDIPFSEDFMRGTAMLLRGTAGQNVQRMKGNNKMKITDRKKLFRIAAAAAAFTILLTGTVYAAKMLLTPSQVARELGEDWVAEAFESENAVEIGDTQRFGEYLITLDGIATGKALSAVTEDIISDDAGDRSYAVFTIARADGTPMADDCVEMLPFMLSPVVNGIEPWRLSIFNLDASSMEMASNGVRYILMETESLEKFADWGVRIVAYEGFAPSSDIFAVLPDGTTGYNENYKGDRVIFDLPLDPAKADPEAVRQLLESIEAEWQEDAEAEDDDAEWQADISAESDSGNFIYSMSDDLSPELAEADLYTFVCTHSDGETTIAETAAVDSGDNTGYSGHAKQLLEMNKDYVAVRVYKGTATDPKNFVAEFSRQS